MASLSRRGFALVNDKSERERTDKIEATRLRVLCVTAGQGELPLDRFTFFSEQLYVYLRVACMALALGTSV